MTTTDTRHSLHLDQRQRDMLAAMGITLWWPEAQAEARPAPGANAHAATQPPVTPSASTSAAGSHGQPTARKAEKYIAENAIEISVGATFHSEPSPSSPPTEVPATPADWSALTKAIQNCTACGLCQNRKQAIVGMGHAKPRWLMVGEAPDEQADKSGQPFVGPEGQLLDAMLTAMGLDREADVYLTHAIKCRPPHNRNPDASELARCTPFLHQQIALLQPDIIVAMGRMAAQAVLAGEADVPQGNAPLGKLRGRIHQAHGKPVVVTYHPDYLLRTPAKKAEAWYDLCLAMAQIGYNPLQTKFTDTPHR